MPTRRKIFSHTFPSSIFLAEFTVSATDILKANGGEGSAAGNMCRLKRNWKCCSDGCLSCVDLMISGICLVNFVYSYTNWLRPPLHRREWYNITWIFTKHWTAALTVSHVMWQDWRACSHTIIWQVDVRRRLTQSKSKLSEIAYIILLASLWWPIKPSRSKADGCELPPPITQMSVDSRNLYHSFQA